MWSQQDSNLWPHRCERCALPTEPCDLIPNFLAFSTEIVRSFQLPAQVGLVYQWAGHLRYSWTGSLITWPVGSTNWAMRPFHLPVLVNRNVIQRQKTNEPLFTSLRFFWSGFKFSINQRYCQEIKMHLLYGICKRCSRYMIENCLRKTLSWMFITHGWSFARWIFMCSDDEENSLREKIKAMIWAGVARKTKNLRMQIWY